MRTIAAIGLVFLFGIGRLYAQDLIVTNNGDSLNCKITKIKNKEISFTYKHLGKITSTRLRLDEVKVCQFKYFEVPEVPVELILAKQIYPRIRIAAHGGYAYRTAEIEHYFDVMFNLECSSTDLTDYVKKLKHGFNYGFDVSYYFNRYCGIGIGYNAFQSKNKLENFEIVIDPDWPNSYGEMNDNIRVDFVGAFFNSRFLHAKDKNALWLGLGIGYINYCDKGRMLSTNLTVEGGNVGLCGNLGYDISISKNLAIGFQFSYIFGKPTIGYSYTLYQGTVDVKENLSRIDLSAGLRFNIWKL